MKDLTDHATGEITHIADDTLDTGIVDLSVLKRSVDRLVGLKHAAEDAATDYADAIKHVAGKAGIKTSALNKFITAKAGEKYADKRAEHGQLSLLFAEYPA